MRGCGARASLCVHFVRNAVSARNEKGAQNTYSQYTSLADGEAVEFEVVNDDRTGKTRAEDVSGRCWV